MPRVNESQLSPEARARLTKAREEAPGVRAQVQAEKADLIAQDRPAREESLARIEERRGILQVLREIREAQGLSLAEVERRAGFGMAMLCRLETDFRANPTVDTLQRYARAVGKKLVIGLVDETPASESGRPARRTRVAGKSR